MIQCIVAYFAGLISGVIVTIALAALASGRERER